MTEPGFTPVLQEAAFTPEEENVLKARLFTLLSKQVRLRTQGDHSSLREEDAAELLRSLLFTLRYQIFLRGLSLRVLLTADLSTLLAQGQESLRRFLDAAETLYREALQTVHTFGSRSLADTLSGIGGFFRGYDLRLYAHRIPADIDYQLCLPAAAGLRGVLYINDYLERLLTENRLLSCFAPERVSALLRRVSPDFQELLLNLYEPAAANAVGLAMLTRDVQALMITPAQADALYQSLAHLPKAAAHARLREAAGAVCCTLGLQDTQSRAYLKQTALSLYPRLAASPQSAHGVFAAVQSNTH